jgi:hypothetical protein
MSISQKTGKGKDIGSGIEGGFGRGKIKLEQLKSECTLVLWNYVKLVFGKIGQEKSKLWLFSFHFTSSHHHVI